MFYVYMHLAIHMFELTMPNAGQWMTAILTGYLFPGIIAATFAFDATQLQ